MPILCFTTSIDSAKTANEISGVLAAKHAKSVAIDYRNGEPVALMFTAELNGVDISFRLPCNTNGVLRAMERDRKCPRRLCVVSQARRVAWRIVKTWVEAQMALIESGQSDMAEIFMPYAVIGNGQTLFQAMRDNPRGMLQAASSVRLIGNGSVDGSVIDAEVDV